MNPFTDGAARFFLISAAAVAIFGVVSLVNWGSEVQCRNTAEAMGVEYRHSLNTPCLIKPEGKPWVPLNNYRVN